MNKFSVLKKNAFNLGKALLWTAPVALSAGAVAGGVHGINKAKNEMREEGKKLTQYGNDFKSKLPLYMLGSAASAGLGAILTNKFMDGSSQNNTSPEPSNTQLPFRQGALRESFNLPYMHRNQMSPSVTNDYPRLNYPKYSNLSKESIGKLLAGIGAVGLPAATYGAYRLAKDGIYNSTVADPEYAKGMYTIRNGQNQIQQINKIAPWAAMLGGGAIGSVGTAMFNK